MAANQQKGRLFQAILGDETVLVRAIDINQAEKYIRSKGALRPQVQFAHNFEIEALRQMGAPEYDARE